MGRGEAGSDIELLDLPQEHLAQGLPHPKYTRLSDLRELWGDLLKKTLEWEDMKILSYLG